MKKTNWKKKGNGWVCTFDKLSRMIFENELINNDSVEWGKLKRRYKKYGLTEEWINDHCNGNGRAYTLYTVGVIYDLPIDFIRAHFDRISRICFSRALLNSSYVNLEFIREFADRFDKEDWLSLLHNGDSGLTLDNKEFQDYFEAYDYFEGYNF